jgi:hypothetical protein
VARRDEPTERPLSGFHQLAKASTLALILRALDAHQCGETYRDIARALFGVTRVPRGSAWKTHDVRDRTIRLVRTGVRLMRGGYLDLLRHPQHRNPS